MNEHLSRISDSELEVMKLVWNHQRVTANTLASEIPQELGWSEKTVKTLINRLLNKGVIGYEKEGKQYLYYPLIDKETYQKSESASFLNKLFDGSVQDLLVSFVKSRKLSAAELDEFKKLLEEGSDHVDAAR